MIPSVLPTHSLVRVEHHHLSTPQELARNTPRTLSSILGPPRPSSSAEAAPLIERLSLVEDEAKFPPTTSSKCFTGTYQGAQINVVTNGKCKRFGVDQIGTVAAGLTTWLSVQVGRRAYQSVTWAPRALQQPSPPPFL